MKKYVYIQSTRPIFVTSGLDLKNVTANNTNRENNFKVKPMWPSTTILLKEGRHLYPSIVATFKSVMSLVKNGVCTIGEETDTVPESEKQSIMEYNRKLKKLIVEQKEKEEEVVEEKPKRKKSQPKETTEE